MQAMILRNQKPSPLHVLHLPSSADSTGSTSIWLQLLLLVFRVWLARSSLWLQTGDTGRRGLCRVVTVVFMLDQLCVESDELQNEQSKRVNL